MNSPLQRKIVELGEKGYFTSATLELTSGCNLGCRYCYVDPPDKELSTNEVISVIDRLENAGVLSLLVTGGEIFSRNDIGEILAYIAGKSFIITHLLSNGTLIKEDHIALLSKYQRLIGYIRISFFSHDPIIHDGYTGVSGSFAAAFGNAQRLKELGVEVLLIVNVTTENVDTLQETKAFFRTHGFSVSEGITKTPTPHWDNKEFLALTSKEFFKRYFKQFSKQEIVRQYNEKIKTNGLPESDQPVCQRLFSTIAIRSDGSIVPCIAFRSHSISNVRTDNRPLQEILRTSALLQELRSVTIAQIGECGTCEFNEKCLFCPGMMYSEHGSFSRPLNQSCNFIEAAHECISQK